MTFLFLRRFNWFDVLGLSLVGALLSHNFLATALGAAIVFAMLSVIGERKVQELNK